MSVPKPAPVAIKIHPIPPTQTSPIRHTVLWPSISPDAQLLPYDSDTTTFHLGAFLTDPTPATATSIGLDPALYAPPSPTDAPLPPVGVLTVTLESYTGTRAPDSPSPAREVQLHKFAVLPQLQGHGLGRKLLEAALEHVRETTTERPVLFHFDARANRTGFYEHLGMRVLDPTVFAKRGPTGEGPAIDHVRMGTLIE